MKNMNNSKVGSDQVRSARLALVKQFAAGNLGLLRHFRGRSSSRTPQPSLRSRSKKSCRLQHSHTHTHAPGSHQSKRHMFLCTHREAVQQRVFISFFFSPAWHNESKPLLPLNSAARRRSLGIWLYEIGSKSQSGCSRSPANPGHGGLSKKCLVFLLPCLCLALGMKGGWGKYFSRARWSRLGEGNEVGKRMGDERDLSHIRRAGEQAVKAGDGEVEGKEMIWRSERRQGGKSEEE